MSYNPAYAKRYSVEYARGQRRMVPVADDVLPHLRRLTAVGVSGKGIAEAAGVSQNCLAKVLRGERQHVHSGVARKILAVRSLEVIPDGRLVGATGTRRRLQALLAIGWTHALLSERSGGLHTHVLASQEGRQVTARVHRQVVALYNELSMTPGPSKRNRTLARNRGYAPPLAWDDEDIDDPTAQPNLGGPDELVRGRRPGSGTPNLHFNEVLALLEMGEAEEDVARKAGISVKSLRRRLQRNQEREAA